MDEREAEGFRELAEQMKGLQELAHAKLREYLIKLPVEKIKEELRECDIATLKYFKRVSLPLEDYEFCQAVDEIIREKGNYLTPEVKKERDEYFFKTLIYVTEEFERLEPSIKDLLSELNLKQNISTKRASNRTERFTETLSYIQIYYTEETEPKIVDELIPYFTDTYQKRLRIPGSDEVHTFMGDVDCFAEIKVDDNGSRYFDLSIDSPENDFHAKFWEDVKEKIGSL